MKARFNVTLKKLPGKRKKAIQLSLAAGFRMIDSITGDVNYKYLKLLIGESILETNWDQNTQRPSESFSTRDKFKLHHLIDRRIAQLENAYLSLVDSELHDAITPADVREEYKRLTGEARKTQIQSRVTDFINHYIKHSRKEKEKTKSHYRLLEKRLREFEAETKTCLYWQTFSSELHEAFVRWLQDKYSLGNNSLWNLEKFLVKFRNLARQRGLIILDSNWVRQTRYQQEEKIYLTWEMVKAVMDHQPETDALRNAKQIFLLLTFTGLRYSDLATFLRAYVDDHPFGWAKLTVKKYPSAQIVVPALEPVRQVMCQNQPHYICPSHFHGQVKVLMSKIFGAETGKLISAHTCRRTFVTLLLQYVPEPVLAKITGHKISGASAVFHGYNRIGLKDNALLFMRHVRNIPLDETKGIKLVRFSEELVMN